MKSSTRKYSMPYLDGVALQACWLTFIVLDRRRGSPLAALAVFLGCGMTSGFFKDAAPYLLAAAALIPTLATAGASIRGRADPVVAERPAMPNGKAEKSLPAKGSARPAEQSVLDSITDYFLNRLSRPDRSCLVWPRRARA